MVTALRTHLSAGKLYAKQVADLWLLWTDVHWDGSPLTRHNLELLEKIGDCLH